MLDIHELAERETLGFAPPPPQPGRSIAEFDCATDARDYASERRLRMAESGERY